MISDLPDENLNPTISTSAVRNGIAASNAYTIILSIPPPYSDGFFLLYVVIFFDLPIICTVFRCYVYPIMIFHTWGIMDYRNFELNSQFYWRWGKFHILEGIGEKNRAETKMAGCGADDRF